MGLERITELAPFVKEGLQQSLRVAKFFCCVHVTNAYLCTFAYTVGPSMLPTFNLQGNLVLAERLTTRLGKVGSGDVVLIRSPDNPRKVVTKRVKGVQGDVVSFFVDPNKSDEQRTVIVPKGHIWIEGDNIYKSNDSRKFGPVPYALLQARVICIVWPPEDFKLVGNKVL
ncbi:mitochondrial ATP-independent inner membrane protease subunit 1a-like [Primulina huaijiensis]|uniref:mitochondrial ATP-independent inner membrane protease subunit 1a-like n=1 Tax=Primulina huaijiensis TaxID=1492673 RepID=UPI003CC789A5